MVDAVAARLLAQGLTGPPSSSVEDVVGRLVGIQAQDLAFARLAFRPRCSADVVASDVDSALHAGELVWTWAMRGTLHLVLASDVGWLLGLLGPIFATRGRPRRLALGLDDELCERALDALRKTVADGEPRTRSELAARAGIDARGQAPAHLVAYAAMRGVLRRVPGREPTFTRLEQPVVRIDEEQALERLARRYEAGHASASAEDLAAWSGIIPRRARGALEAIAPERPGDAHVPAVARPHVALLGHFDPYLLGYASRELVLDPRFATRIQSGGGFIAPAALVDGRVVGTWRRDGGDDGWLEPFEPLPSEALDALARERADVERFLNDAA